MWRLLLVVALVMGLLAGCTQLPPTPTPDLQATIAAATATRIAGQATPTPTPTYIPTPTATATPQPTATPTPTAIATPTPTATAIPKPTPTVTPTPVLGKIVFVSNRGGIRGIYVMPAVPAATPVMLTNNPRGDKHPRWFPDGKRIVFVSNRLAPYGESNWTDIYVMDADGGNVVQLTSDEAAEDFPDVSPDGTKILFAKNAQIYVMAVDGSNVRPLTQEGQSFQPRWSPDGSKIAFGHSLPSTACDGCFLEEQIWTMNADGSNQVQLFQDPKEAWAPSWSPDGRLIAYVTYKHASPGGYNSEIYVVTADGSFHVRVTFDSEQGPDGSLYDDTPVWTLTRDLVIARGGELYLLKWPEFNLVRLMYNPAGDGQPDWAP